MTQQDASKKLKGPNFFLPCQNIKLFTSENTLLIFFNSTKKTCKQCAQLFWAKKKKFSCMSQCLQFSAVASFLQKAIVKACHWHATLFPHIQTHFGYSENFGPLPVRGSFVIICFYQGFEAGKNLLEPTAKYPKSWCRLVIGKFCKTPFFPLQK